MVDTAPPKSQLRGAKNYYKGGHRYADGTWVCENCSYADDKTCGQCVFARWNIDGINEGFRPADAHRMAHPEAYSDAVRGSPLLQKFSMDTVEHRGIQQRVSKDPARLAKQIADGTNAILQQSGHRGLVINEEYVKRFLERAGRSPIENGSPNLTSLPKTMMPYPGMPTRQDAPLALQRLYEVRKNLDH